MCASPTEIAAVAGHAADVLVAIRPGLADAERVVDEFFPKLLIRAAVAGPTTRDLRRNRRIIADAARSHLLREGINQLAGGIDGLTNPVKNSVIIDVERRTNVVDIQPVAVKQHGVIAGSKKADAPIGGKGTAGPSGTARIGSIEEAANGIISSRLIRGRKSRSIPLSYIRNNCGRRSRGVVAGECR